MKILTTVTASAGLDVASTGSDTIKLGSVNIENNDAVVDNLIVWANADFKNNVTLGSSVADNTLVNSKLTASNGLYVSGNLYVNGVNITASSGGSGGGSGISAQDVSGALTVYAKSTDVSSSFVDNSELTSAINNFPTRAEVTGSTNSILSTVAATYATLTGVSGTFVTPSQATSALSPYATLTGVSASFVRGTEVSASFATTTQVTSALNPYATLTGVSGTFVTNAVATSSIAFLTASNRFTTSQIITGSLTASSDILIGSLRLGRGTGNNVNSAVFGLNAGGTSVTNTVAIGSTAAFNANLMNASVAIGANALYTNINGLANNAVGTDALKNLSSDKSYNNALGYYALRGLTNGNYNIGIGNNAATNITAGEACVFIGGHTGTGYNNLTGTVLISDGNGNIKLSANSSGLVNIPYGLTVSGSLTLQSTSYLTSSGIKFPSTQVATTDANTLDDYEEGNWTPAISSSVSNYTTGSFTHGSYVKIGKNVFIKGTIQLTSYGTSSGTIFILGVPFANNNVGGWSANIPIGYYSGLSSSVEPMTSINANSATMILSYASGASAAALTVSQITNNAMITFNGYYVSNS